MERGETSLRQSLDGMWRFAWSGTPALRPENFWQEGCDDSDFGTIQVPGHMELQGYGQIQYINTLCPWDGRAGLRPPQIDWEDCPVGSYVREFDLDPGLRGKKVCISFQGVEQACYVWLNGNFVGYAEDSFTPSEFDLTPYIRETGNRLCVEVYKRSSAAWIEDQDFFRFSGIFRSVFLCAKPALPLFGLRFAAPEPVERVEWLGLSGETYPDRKKGGVFGWQRTDGKARLCLGESKNLRKQEANYHGKSNYKRKSFQGNDQQKHLRTLFRASGPVHL